MRPTDFWRISNLRRKWIIKIILVKGINKSLGVTLPTNPHELVERYSCDSSNACMNSVCSSCVMPRGWTYPLDESASDEPSHSDGSDTEEYREISFYKVDQERWQGTKDLLSLWRRMRQRKLGEKQYKH